MEKIITDRPVPLQTHKTWGLYTGLAVVVVTALLYVLKVHQTTLGNWAPMIVMLGGLLMNANAFSKVNGGAVTFGQVFSSGFKATAIITLIGIAWALISVYVFPEIKEHAIEEAQRNIEGQGDVTEAQMSTAINLTRKYFTLFMVMGTLFTYMVVGLICSLIAAAVAPKNQMPR